MKGVVKDLASNIEIALTGKKIKGQISEDKKVNLGQQILERALLEYIRNRHDQLKDGIIEKELYVNKKDHLKLKEIYYPTIKNSEGEESKVEAL